VRVSLRGWPTRGSNGRSVARLRLLRGLRWFLGEPCIRSDRDWTDIGQALQSALGFGNTRSGDADMDLPEISGAKSSGDKVPRFAIAGRGIQRLLNPTRRCPAVSSLLRAHDDGLFARRAAREDETGWYRDEKRESALHSKRQHMRTITPRLCRSITYSRLRSSTTAAMAIAMIMHTTTEMIAAAMAAPTVPPAA
jgi:hypothetical protein